MIFIPHRGGKVIVFTFALAMVLTIAPLPESLHAYRPDWVGLVLIYWCFALPERVGVFSGWLAGLLLDVLTSGLLGQHALALCLVAYLTIKIHQQVRVFPLWQQALAVLILLAVHQLVLLWTNSVIGRPGPGLIFWIAPLIGAAIWPLIYSLLRALRHGFSVR
ncbi:MAG: rod shape-determining protein MreD [Gammaproteobacteria bacterium]